MRNKYKNIVNKEKSQSRDTICYSIGSLCSSAASMIILLVVTKILGEKATGVFSLSWSAAQLFLTVGWFGTRQYIVADINEIIGYREYRVAKIISVLIMEIVGIAYVKIYHFDLETRRVTFFLCLLMITEVFADFFSSYFQHKDKLYIGGISYTIRNILYMLVFSMVLFMSRRLELAILASFVVVVIWLGLFDVQLLREIPMKNDSLEIANILNVFRECFPLFVGLFITSFIMNIPKNAINQYLSYSDQAVYNILFMPTSVINLLYMFIAIPYYGRLAELWQRENKIAFWKMIYKIIGVVFLVTVVVLVGGVTIGIPVLTWLYGVNLEPYRFEFAVLISGGGCYGFISLLTYVLTIFRKQRISVYVYFVCAVLTQMFANRIVRMYGLPGATLTYSMSMGSICILLIFGIIYYTIYQVNNKRKMI